MTFLQETKFSISIDGTMPERVFAKSQFFNLVQKIGFRFFGGCVRADVGSQDEASTKMTFGVDSQIMYQDVQCFEYLEVAFAHDQVGEEEGALGVLSMADVLV